jgi:putative spermidine/putrescine transport system substrate-binding protein
MHRRALAAAFAGLVLLLAACAQPVPPPARVPLLSRSWGEIERQARGQTVTLVMWKGDPAVNAYMDRFVVPALASRYGIALRIVDGQGSAIVSSLRSEIEGGRSQNGIDLAAVNGEAFAPLRRINALFGPFTAKLPNAPLVDLKDPLIAYDFQQEVAGYECPWGTSQLALIYDRRRVASPPYSRQALAAWVRAHPGRFTFDSSFTGMTFLKSLMIDLGGSPTALDGPFDEARYDRLSAALLAYVNAIKPYLWKEGDTFPTGVAELHRLFAAGEVDFTMSTNDGEADNKVATGELPPTSRAYVPDFGTIRSSRYLAIPKRAPHLAGALVAVNFLISPEAQYAKLLPTTWGDGAVLDVSRLPRAWQEKFAAVPARRYGPQRAEIAPRALREPDAEYLVRLYDDFRKHVLRG